MVLAPGDVARVTLDIPEVDDIAAELCPKKEEGKAPLFVVLREENTGRSAPPWPSAATGNPASRAGP